MQPIADKPQFVKNALIFDFQLPFNARIGNLHFTIRDERSHETVGFRFIPKELRGADEGVRLVVLAARGGFFDIAISKAELGRSDKLSEAFDGLIWHLNNFLSSYVVITKDTFPNFVSLHSVPLAVWHYLEINRELRQHELMQHFEGHIGEAERGILLLGWARATKGMTVLPPIDEEAMGRIIRHMNPSDKFANPFFNSELFYVLGRKYLEEASYAVAVVSMHTSVETFLYALLTVIGLDTELAARYPSVEAYLEDNLFAAVVRRAFQKHLKGINWDFSVASSPLFAYFAGPYHLRNRVIHGGYYPTLTEAQDALARTDEVRRLLVQAVQRQHRELYRRYLG